jgi:hypothetical protein
MKLDNKVKRQNVKALAKRFFHVPHSTKRFFHKNLVDS